MSAKIAPKVNTPAMDLYYKVQKDILRMPGVKSMTIFGSKRPNELGVNAVDERAAAAVYSVMEQEIEGVKLNVYLPGSREPFTGGPIGLHDRIAVIDALTGVWDHKGNILRRGNGTITFKTINEEVIQRLDPLLKNRYDMGVDSKGWKVWVNVRWKAGVPTPPA